MGMVLVVTFYVCQEVVFSRLSTCLFVCLFIRNTTQKQLPGSPAYTSGWRRWIHKCYLTYSNIFTLFSGNNSWMYYIIFRALIWSLSVSSLLKLHWTKWACLAFVEVFVWLWMLSVAVTTLQRLPEDSFIISSHRGRSGLDTIHRDFCFSWVLYKHPTWFDSFPMTLLVCD